MKSTMILVVGAGVAVAWALSGCAPKPASQAPSVAGATEATAKAGADQAKEPPRMPSSEEMAKFADRPKELETGDSQAVPNGTVVEFKVDGMTEEKDQAAVARMLADIPGVGASVVDLGAGIARVVYDGSKTDAQKIEAAFNGKSPKMKLRSAK